MGWKGLGRGISAVFLTFPNLLVRYAEFLKILSGLSVCFPVLVFSLKYLEFNSIQMVPLMMCNFAKSKIYYIFY